MENKLESYLSKNLIKYKEHLHRAVFTVSESKDLKKSVPGLHCKCLFLKDESENFYLVAMPAEKRLDIGKLRKNLKAKKIYFASEKELYDLLALKPGSVSIFGMINDINNKVNLIVDKEVWSSEVVGFHPNINTSTLVLLHQDLVRFYNSLNQNKMVMDV